ncbi:hypothetical protein GCM10009801_75000 [Streptomyces albiaxialis]|uniref:Uncharacterized protein n=1 Tax=Streptomyces albiaxialis TaxID=329523 RepID=A0ABN2WYQ7_9ACTN
MARTTCAKFGPDRSRAKRTSLWLFPSDFGRTSSGIVRRLRIMHTLLLAFAAGDPLSMFRHAEVSKPFPTVTGGWSVRLPGVRGTPGSACGSLGT